MKRRGIDRKGEGKRERTRIMLSPNVLCVEVRRAMRGGEEKGEDGEKRAGKGPWSFSAYNWARYLNANPIALQ